MKKKLITTLVLSGIITAMVATPAMASVLPSEGSLTGGLGSGLNPSASAQKETVSDGDLIALDDIGISIVADGYKVISQNDGFVYIYTMEEDDYPYVIIGRYDFEDENFADLFTEYMGGVYNDLDVDSLQEGVKVGNYKFDIIKYDYSVGSAYIDDTRMFVGIDGYTYMFGSKESDNMDLELPEDYLKKVAGSFEVVEDFDDFENHVNEDTRMTGSGSAAKGDFSDDDIVQNLQDLFENSDIDLSELFGDDFDLNELMNGDIDFDDDNDLLAKIEFETDMAPYDGVWVEFEDGFKLYLPSNWMEYLPDPDQQEAGCFYQAGADDAQTNENAPYIFVLFSDAADIDSFEDFTEELEYSGYEVDGMVSVNGLVGLAYSYEEYDMSGIAFFHPDTDDYVLSVVTYNYSKNQDIQSAILCSLTPIPQ